jgi:hypothetical protein
MAVSGDVSTGPSRRPAGGVAHDAVHRSHAVPPADLLALGVGASVVGDPDLVDPPPAGGDLGRHLRFEAEAVLFDLDRLDDLAAEGLVTGLHVGEVQVGEDVGDGGQELVADRVPVVEDSVGPVVVEAGAEADVGPAVDQRFE